MQIAAGLEPTRQQRDKVSLHETALVVAFLRPGVGEEYVRTVKRNRRDHVAQHLGRVVLDDAQVGQPARVDQLEQAADTGRMDFDAKVVDLRVRRSNCRGRLAHAEAYFQDFRSRPAKYFFQINRLRRIGNPITGQQLVMRARLGNRDAALAQDVTANRALWIGFWVHESVGLREFGFFPKETSRGAV